MAAPRRGAKKSRSSTPSLLLWAAVVLLLGVGMGLLLSHSSCSRKDHRSSPHEKAPKPAPKRHVPPPSQAEPEAPKAQPPEPMPQPAPPEKPERPLSPEKAPLPKPEKPAKVEAHPEPAKPAKPATVKQPEKQPAAKPSPAAKSQAPEPQKHSPLPKLALLIDDLGYAQPESVKRLCKEPVPFSVAVLPYQEYSLECANIAYAMGKEILLHLPMEPIGYPGPGKDPGPSAVMFDLKEAEIRARVKAAMAAVPHVRGVNNHMGSRITPDRPRMTWVLQEIKARHFFFVDSRTEKDSVAFDVARALKIPCVQRRVFLDDDKSFNEMSKQWERAIEIAQKEGEVVIIGHIYPETVEALEKLIPRARNRVQFVRAGDLAR